jgi:hypothetical protein
MQAMPPTRTILEIEKEVAKSQCHLQCRQARLTSAGQRSTVGVPEVSSPGAKRNGRVRGSKTSDDSDEMMETTHFLIDT